MAFLWQNLKKNSNYIPDSSKGNTPNEKGSDNQQTSAKVITQQNSEKNKKRKVSQIDKMNKKKSVGV